MIDRQGLWCLRLSAREIQILMLLLEGSSLQEVAERLKISRRTVEYHLYDVQQRLNVAQNTRRLREAWDRSGAANVPDGAGILE